MGGLHPDWSFSYYVDMVRMLKSLCPQTVLKMYDVVEIDYFSRILDKSVERVLEDLMEAGLQALPGGGAELFATRVRNILYPEKISVQR